ncbi:MAG: hypothetical protein JWM92_597 [Candidatus Nomurabacteria bacterium]|nr:hypothetical protein [Candidatus Nomurabacteria bacterium]
MGKITLTTVLIGTLAAAFLSLVAYNVKDIAFGTPFTVQAAAVDGATVNGMFMPISGSTKHAQQITINGRTVGVDPQGNFKDGVVLSPGYNIVEVTERDQFGKTKTVAYHWVVAPSVSVAQNDVSPYQR